MGQASLHPLFFFNMTAVGNKPGPAIRRLHPDCRVLMPDNDTWNPLHTQFYQNGRLQGV